MNIHKKYLEISLSTCFGIAAALLSPLPAAAQPLYGAVGHYEINIRPNQAGPTGVGGDLETYAYALAAHNEPFHLTWLKGSLATGTVQALALSNRSGDEVFGYDSGEAKANIKIYDTLGFTVPAGSYPNGLYADAEGSLSGSMDSHGRDTEVFMQWKAQFAPYESETPSGVRMGWSDFPGSIDESFVLSALLVNPGTILTDPLLVNIPILAELSVGVSTWSTLWEDGRAEADFFNTLGFTSITAPAGVTWTSASGKFLSQPIPEPGMAWLFGSGLFVLALLKLGGKIQRKAS